MARNDLEKGRVSFVCGCFRSYYNEDDYIRDYDEFLKCVKEGYWKHENKL